MRKMHNPAREIYWGSLIIAYIAQIHNATRYAGHEWGGWLKFLTPMTLKPWGHLKSDRGDFAYAVIPMIGHIHLPTAVHIDPKRVAESSRCARAIQISRKTKNSGQRADHAPRTDFADLAVDAI